MKALTFVLLLLLGSSAFGQATVPQAVSTSSGQSDPEYRLGIGDLIEVSVFGVSNFNHTVRVDSKGIVEVPLLEPIPAAGLTTVELARKLESMLDTELIRNPRVSVLVREYRSQSFYVFGAVGRPGQYQINKELRLLEALSLAGGVQANAGDEATIQRQPAANDPTAVQTADGVAPASIKVNLKELVERHQPSMDVVIQSGDVINIPIKPADVFYVIGEVNRAGAISLPPGQNVLVTQALAWAGGPMKTAKMNKGMLVRYENGARRELPVDFSAILKGRKPDFEVRANDVIFIEGSTFKNITYGLMGIIPGTVASVPTMIGR